MDKRPGGVLITGGCGFIGANLVPYMETMGYSIRVLDNLSKGRAEYLGGTNAEIKFGDIRKSEDVADALRGIDGVIHLAAFGSVVESIQDPGENFDVNVRGTLTVLEACRNAGIKKIVFSSTGGALIGDAVPPVDESSVARPISPYGSSKLCGEAYCCSFAKCYGMDIVAARFANVVGPQSAHKKGAITSFINSIRQNTPIVIYGDGSATRDFLDVSDLCIGIESAYRAHIPGFTPVHLASGREVSVLELATIVRNVAGKPDHPLEFREKRTGEVDRNFANSGLARQLLGFAPQVELEDSIAATWAWFKELP